MRVGRCVGDGDGGSVVGIGVGMGDGARVGRGVGVDVGRRVGAKTGAAVGLPGRGVGAGVGAGVGRCVGDGDGPGVVGCAVVGAGDGADVVGRGVGFGVGPGVGAVDGAGEGGKPTTTSASAAIVEAAKSVRCVHAHVTPDAVDATTEQPSEDQPLSQNEHAAVFAGQLTVISSGRLADVTVVVDPSGSVTTRGSPQSKVVGTSQSKRRTWDRLKHVSVRVPGSQSASSVGS